VVVSALVLEGTRALATYSAMFTGWPLSTG
jgi:hypothetical protein